jgi:WD40 repeat protein
MERMVELRGHSDWVNGGCFSRDGQSVLSASHDQTVGLWDLQQQKAGAAPKLKARLEGHGNWVLSCDLSHSGRLAVSGSYSAELFVWDVERQTVVNFLSQQKGGGGSRGQGHSQRVNACRFVGGMDEQFVVSASHDRTVCVWDVRQAGGPQPVTKFHTKGYATALAVGARDSNLSAGDSLGNVYFLDLYSRS